jgi:lipoate-protein ligase B
MSADAPGAIEVEWLGRVDYAAALELQRAARTAVIERRGPERLMLLEHPATVTLGRRGGQVSVEALAHAQIPVVPCERGGLATLHAPGQLVVYLIADLGRRRWRVPEVVGALEEGVIRWLAEHRVAATRRDGSPGVWVGQAKIAAIGLHISHHVSMHGLALNLAPDLRLFDAIVPCGLVGAQVTSLAALTGTAPEVAAAASTVGASVLAALNEISHEVSPDPLGAV